MHRDDIELLLEEVWWRADAALVMIMSGTTAATAVTSTRLLALFDGTFDDAIADVFDTTVDDYTAERGGLEHGEDTDETALTLVARRLGVQNLDDPAGAIAARREALVTEALGQMLDVCCAPGSVDSADDSVVRLVMLAAMIAACVPDATWQLRIEQMLHAIAAGSEHTPALASARNDAVARLGSLSRVLDAVESWAPEPDERRRLRELVSLGYGIDAIRQALDQAVFAAELAEWSRTRLDGPAAAQ